MKVEVLFPEFCNLYGDMSNIKYLEKSVKDIEIIYTALNATPVFLSQDIDLVYMGPMTEKTQEKIIKKLLPYKGRIEELIANNKVFLFTGNAFEIFGKYIEKDDESRIEGLGILDFYSKRNMLNRYAGMILGEYEDISIIGFKNQFSQTYGNNENTYFIKAKKGIGINPESTLEGIRYNNFFGTYILGPLFILNPLFMKKILEITNVKDYELAFEQEIMDAYNQRLEEFTKLTF